MFTTQKRAHYIANLVNVSVYWLGFDQSSLSNLGILVWLQSVVLITPNVIFLVVCCWDLHQFVGILFYW